MTAVTVTYEGFIATFDEFSDTTEYPVTVVNAYLVIAQNYISAVNSTALKDDAREYAIYLMTAHLLTLKKRRDSESSTGGYSAGYEISATTQDVSVSLAAPVSKTMRERWFDLTGYGLELWALLGMKAAVPMLVGKNAPRYIK